MCFTSEKGSLTRERLRLLSGDRAQMLQVGLVADEHDDDVRVGVIAELLQPALHVHVRRLLGDVIHQERADRATVVSKCVSDTALLYSDAATQRSNAGCRIWRMTHAEVIARYRSCPAEKRTSALVVNV